MESEVRFAMAAELCPASLMRTTFSELVQKFATENKDRKILSVQHSTCVVEHQILLSVVFTYNLDNG